MGKICRRFCQQFRYRRRCRRHMVLPQTTAVATSLKSKTQFQTAHRKFKVVVTILFLKSMKEFQVLFPNLYIINQVGTIILNKEKLSLSCQVIRKTLPKPNVYNKQVMRVMLISCHLKSMLDTTEKTLGKMILTYSKIWKEKS